MDYLFKDRETAGRDLAISLERYRRANTLVLGLPRGGVVVAKFHMLQWVVSTVSLTPPPAIGVRVSMHGSGSAAPAAPVQFAAAAPLRSTVILASSVPAGMDDPSIWNVSVIGLATVPCSGVVLSGSVAAISSCWPKTV